MKITEENTNLSRRKFLKWTAGGIIGAGALTLGLKPWKRTASGFTTVTQTRSGMGTFITITALGEKEERVNKLVNAAYEKINQVDKTMSVFKGKSEVYRLNSPGNKRIKLTPQTLEVLEEAKRISRLTDGSFDITSAPLLDLWGFYDGELSVPSQEELEETLKLVNYRGLNLNAFNLSATLADPRGKIDLGGIAKGYGVDQAVKVLREGGLPGGLVNAGGDIRGYGSPETKNNWRVGLQNPLVENDLIAEMDLVLPSVTTSGNYESFFTYQGSKLAHIIDPKTGRPVEDVLSVSVLTDSAVKADGLSTGAFSQSAKEALDTVKKLEGTELIYIRKDGSGNVLVDTTEGLEDRLDAREMEAALNSRL